MKNPLKKSLAGGKLTLGSWITFADTAAVEIMAKSGFDWLAVDMEHSPIDISAAQHLIQVIELCGTVPLVRVSSNDPIIIKRVMDAGAYGVIIPMINNAEDARKAISAVKYPPLGTRGVGLARAQGYGKSFEEYRDTINSQSVVIFQIEHKEAVENIDEILDVKGADALIIGPYDMSGSYGIPGEFDHPLMKNALARVLKAAKKSGMPLGIHIVYPDPRMLRKRIKEGYPFIAYGVDMIFLLEQCRQAMRSFRDITKR